MELDKKDIELVNQARKGSLEAFEQLIKKYSRYLLSISYGLLGSAEDAEEVVQDTFVKAYTKISSLKDDSLFGAWISRIVVNMSRNRYTWNRSRGEGQNVSIHAKDENNDDEKEFEIPSNLAAPDEELEQEEIQKFIIEGINALPDMFREPLILRHVKDMSYKEISNILNLNIETVKTRISRGRAMLAVKLKNKL